MKLISFLYLTVMIFTTTSLFAQSEKCYVTGNDGISAIKPGNGDTDPKALDDEDTTPWIYVPMGKCNQINRGNFEGISDYIQNKINKNKL